LSRWAREASHRNLGDRRLLWPWRPRRGAVRARGCGAFWLASRASFIGPLLFLIIGSLASGCSTRFVRSHAERRIAHKLEDLIGPADEYKVRVRHTRDAEIVVGRLRRIEIDGWNVRAGGQLALESLHLELNDLRYHAPPNEALTVGESLLVIHLTEAALNDYLRRQHPKSPTEVAFHDGTVTLKGTMRLLGGVLTPVETSGRLEIAEGSRIEYHADTVHFPAETAPDAGAEYIEKSLNPLLDVTRLNLPIRLNGIEVEPGRLVVRGTATLPPSAKGR
jgi:LmeA-like phospholipid-binding